MRHELEGPKIDTLVMPELSRRHVSMILQVFTRVTRGTVTDELIVQIPGEMMAGHMQSTKRTADSAH